MMGERQIGRRRATLVPLLVVVLLSVTAVDIVVGIGDSMEPRYDTCDVLIVDSIRDTVSEVHINDVIAYRSGTGVLVHEVVGVASDEGYVWAKGLNGDARDRVTSEMLVGVVVAHLDTSVICSVMD